MALIFPSGSSQSPVTGNLLVGNRQYPLPANQSDLNRVVNGAKTNTAFEYSVPDPVSGGTYVFTYANATSSTSKLVPSTEPVTEEFTPPAEETTAPSDDPAVAAQEEREDADTETPTEPELSAYEQRKLDNARIAAESKKAEEEDKDWRVRLHLPPGSNSLYRSSTPGILWPLSETNGIIFPYTPTINIQHTATYSNYDLVHNNYKGYFYTGSAVQQIIISATFTAQDSKEARYMLAAMHFLKSATKMFYGQDKGMNGTPPPLVMLTGLGEFHFNNHLCAVTMMNYNMPNDTDYISAGKANSTDFDNIERRPAPTRKENLQNKLKTNAVNPNTNADNGPARIHDGETWMPTTMEFNFTMIPIQTRDQVSNEFSLDKYASGELIKRGYW